MNDKIRAIKIQDGCYLEDKDIAGQVSAGQNCSADKTTADLTGNFFKNKVPILKKNSFLASKIENMSNKNAIFIDENTYYFRGQEIKN